MVTITAGKARHATSAIGLTLTYQRPVGSCSRSIWRARVWLGLLPATMFQLAHCVDLADFATPDTPRRGDDFVLHQLHSTVDVHCRTAIGWRSLTWITGGLSYQERHLAPRLPHTAYPLVASRLQTVCAERDTPIRIHATSRQAVCSHTRWLRLMGVRPE